MSMHILCFLNILNMREEQNTKLGVLTKVFDKKKRQITGAGFILLFK